MMHQPMDPRDTDVMNRVDFVTHHFRGHLSFLGGEKIAGSGANHRDLPFPGEPALAVEYGDLVLAHQVRDAVRQLLRDRA